MNRSPNVWFVQNEPEDRLALLEDLVAMRDEEHALEAGLAQSLVVEGGHPRLPRARGRDDEIPEVPALSLGVESLEHFDLKRLGLNVDAQAILCVGIARALLSVERSLEPITVNPRVVRLELGFVPVLLERRADAPDDRRVVD